MKGASLIKETTIKRLIEALRSPETQTKFLGFSKYKDVKKFVRTDMEAGKVADNGQHFLDIMTKALESTPAPALHEKWQELRSANRSYRKKEREKKQSKRQA